MNSHRPTTRVIEVIEVTFIIGKGVVGDPVRQVTAYHRLDGTLLAENDPIAFTGRPPVDSDGFRSDGYVGPGVDNLDAALRSGRLG